MSWNAAGAHPPRSFVVVYFFLRSSHPVGKLGQHTRPKASRPGSAQGERFRKHRHDVLEQLLPSGSDCTSTGRRWFSGKGWAPRSWMTSSMAQRALRLRRPLRATGAGSWFRHDWLPPFAYFLPLSRPWSWRSLLWVDDASVPVRVDRVGYSPNAPKPRHRHCCLLRYLHSEQGARC